MKISELIDELGKYDPEREVIMSKDGEGNHHSPLSSVSTGAYQAETTWMGEYGLEELTKEDKDDGYTDGDVVDGVPALCLHPIN